MLPTLGVEPQDLTLLERYPVLPILWDQLTFPFGKTMDLIYAAGGCLIFSGYIVYDTYIITKRLSPDEYILAAISLYLE